MRAEGPKSPRMTLLLFAAVDGKFYEARLSFTTNPNERRPERRAKRKRKEASEKRPWEDVGVTSLHKHTHESTDNQYGI